MFTPPADPVVIRGSVWGPLSSYWIAVIAWALILWGIGRGSLLGGAAVLVGGLAVFAAVAFVATGTRIEVSATELVVIKRWRPRWRVPISSFRYIVENIPVRPRAPSMAGWTFHAAQPPVAKLEIAMFAPADRRRLRALFRDVIVDADAGMRRPR